jgi:hypothetical protein
VLVTLDRDRTSTTVQFLILRRHWSLILPLCHRSTEAGALPACSPCIENSVHMRVVRGIRYQALLSGTVWGQRGRRAQTLRLELCWQLRRTLLRRAPQAHLAARPSAASKAWTYDAEGMSGPGYGTIRATAKRLKAHSPERVGTLIDLSFTIMLANAAHFCKDCRTGNRLLRKISEALSACQTNIYRHSAAVRKCTERSVTPS